MKNKILVLAAIAATSGMYAFVLTRPVPPADLRDAMAEFTDISVSDIKGRIETDSPAPIPAVPGRSTYKSVPAASAPTALDVPGAQGKESDIFKKFKDVPWQKNSVALKEAHARGQEKSLDFDNLSGEKVGPRFEGWYTRITDADGARTFAFIVGSFLSPGVPFSPEQPMRGYLAVLVSDGAGGALKVYEAFPEKTRFIVNGKPVFNENPQESSMFGGDISGTRSDFAWAASGFGFINNKNFALTIPGEIDIHGNFGAPVPWNGSAAASPEGIATDIPMVPIHWYVHSLGSPSTYEYDLLKEGRTVKSSGYAHIEKNWGKKFPSKWIWSEGIADDNTSHYAFGGGEVSFGPIKPTAYLLGFHTRKVSMDFRPQQGTVFKTITDACRGTFSLMIGRPGKILVVDSAAPPRSFGSVSIPTATGFAAKGGVESFSARTTIKAYEIDLLGKTTLLDEKTFVNAALEFGANNMCGGAGRF